MRIAILLFLCFCYLKKKDIRRTCCLVTHLDCREPQPAKFALFGWDLLSDRKIRGVLLILSLGYHTVERRESNRFWRPVFLKFLPILKFFQYCGWTGGTECSEQTPFFFCYSECKYRKTCDEQGSSLQNYVYWRKIVWETVEQRQAVGAWPENCGSS